MLSIHEINPIAKKNLMRQEEKNGSLEAAKYFSNDIMI
jgi:hypothetical protein